VTSCCRPIGGLKEKTLAAHRAGIKTVIIPKLNEKDLPDVPAEVREQLQFVFAETVDDVLAAALEPKPDQKPADGKNAEQRE
jgi:ATP-dependent Lon protease